MGSPAPSNGDWHTRAACVGTDPKKFTDPRPDSDDAPAAIRCCNRCPVRQACLDTALVHAPDADLGIWGGTTPEIRRAMRRRRTPPAQPKPTIGLFDTLQGDLTDLSGRALAITLPVAPTLLLFVNERPVLRTDQLDDSRHHLATTLDDYQPSQLAPLALTASGDLTDPTGRVTITRVPAPPHLLVVIDERPRRRGPDLQTARRDAIRILTQLPARVVSSMQDSRSAYRRLS